MIQNNCQIYNLDLMLILWEERQPHAVTRPEGKFLPLKGSQDR